MDTTEQALPEVDPMDALLGALDDEPKDEVTADSGETDPLAADSDDSAESDDAETEAVDVVDLDGKKLEIPAGTPPTLVAAVRQMADELKADYTRKTQGAADAARSIQMQAQNLQQQEELFRANTSRMAALVNTQERLSQYEQIDWQTLIDADPVQAQKLQISFQQERTKAETLHREFGQAEQQRQHAQAVQRAQVLQDGMEKLNKAIPNWNEQKRDRVLRNTLSYGFSSDDLQNITDPRLVMALHDAAQWKALQAQKPVALKKVAVAPAVIKPNAPQPRQQNKSALERLHKSGRVEDLAALL